MDLIDQLILDAAAKLNSEPALATVWCGSYHQMVIAEEIEKRMPHLIGRAAGAVTYSGLGILVVPPQERGLFPNIQPPLSEATLAVWVVEQPELNFEASGTKIRAYSAARLVRAILHQFAMEGLCCLYQAEVSIKPLEGCAKEWPGCYGYEVSLVGRIVDPQVPKCAVPLIADNGSGLVTLTKGDALAGETIWFTTDGTFPGPGNVAGVNGACTAVLYAAPFQVAAGTVVRWAAYAAGAYGSDAGQATITD